MANGAEALVRTLVNSGVEVCFTNPGTSEMHFVAALDSAPQMRAVLCLFEGVATGAADGYARMAGKPAATLLHLGCGLGNGLANLHNARKAKTPVVNIVGDHATYHVPFDAQLQSDIETVARNVSPGFVRTSQRTADLARDAVDAISAALGPPGSVATLILPADVSWGEGGAPETAPPRAKPPAADDESIDAVAQAIRTGGRVALLLGGTALGDEAQIVAARLAAQSGVKLFAETFPARMARGAGLPAIERVAYLAEMATLQLRDFDTLALVDAKPPVSFFAYPGKPSSLTADTTKALTLSAPGQDAFASLRKLAVALGADNARPALVSPARPGAPRGKLTAEKVCKAVGHYLPDDAILIDEAVSSGLMLPKFTARSPRHDLVTLTGGAIGQALPSAVGAAIACPDRPVVALVGDGSAMYTIQALWTMAREKLNVTAVVFNNAAYAVLKVELERVGAQQIGPKARAQLDIGSPEMDFSKMAAGMGVDAVRCDTAEGFNQAFARALASPGPHLIEAVAPPTLSGLKLKLLPHLLASLDKIPAPLAHLIKRKLAP